MFVCRGRVSPRQASYLSCPHPGRRPKKRNPKNATRLSASLRCAPGKPASRNSGCGAAKLTARRGAPFKQLPQICSRSIGTLRCQYPQPEPRAAGASTRVGAGTGGLRELRRNGLLAESQQAVAAIEIDKEAIAHPVLPLVTTPATASSWGWQLHRRVQLHRHHFYGNVFERSVEDAK